MEETIRRYFQAWLDADPNAVRGIFAGDAVYSECYGPVYRGADQIIRWFEDWNKKGRVLEWTIKRALAHGNTLVAEWYFKCDYEGVVDGFDGATIADFNEALQIVRLSEYQSKSEHCYPYGE